MLVSGELKTSDHFCHQGAANWQRLITEPPVTAISYLYAGDDVPFYFIRDGFVFGPRTGEEIDALCASGWLAGESLITFLGAEQWWTVLEFIELGGGDAVDAEAVAEAPGFDWISNGIRACVGDPIAKAEIGVQAAKGAYAWLSDVVALAGKYNPEMGDENTQFNCSVCGSSIVPFVARVNGGKCFKCQPMKKIKK